MPGYRLISGDSLTALRQLDDASIDAVVTDPPYGLEFMGKDWDRPWAVGVSATGYTDGGERLPRPGHRDNRNPTCGTCGGRARGAKRCECETPDWKATGAPRGDTRQPGDATFHPAANADTGFGRVRHGAAASYGGNPGSEMRAFQAWVEAWAVECLRVLKPGGHLVAFGGTRTYHRLASGVEDAGFEVRDCLAWMYGSGFPKSLDVSKAIDKAAGAEREVVSRERTRWTATGRNERYGKLDYFDTEDGYEVRETTAPATDGAREWQGWGTALKPAFEPIVLARKPLAGTVAATVLAHGTGAINVDACRVGFRNDADERESKEKNQHGEFESGVRTNHGYGVDGRDRTDYAATGRWPANVLLGHSEGCRVVGEQTVKADGHWPGSRRGGGSFTAASCAQDGLDERSADGEPVAVWDCEPGCAVRLLDEQTGDLQLAGNVTPGDAAWKKPDGQMWGGPSTPSRVYADPGGASRFYYTAKASRVERNAGLDDFEKRAMLWSSGDQSPGTFQAEGTDREQRNHHPTVKPVAVMRWLARLVTPPGGIILDPFTGSGTTGIAAGLEGFEFVGVEREPDYLAIAEARLAFWAEHGDEALEMVRQADRAERARAEVADAGQLDLFSETA